MSLLQVTQSWGMAPVTSPGCCKMLPGEWGGHGTVRLWGQRHSNKVSPALMWRISPGVSLAGDIPVPWQHDLCVPRLGGFPVTPRAVFLGMTCAFRAVAGMTHLRGTNLGLAGSTAAPSLWVFGPRVTPERSCGWWQLQDNPSHHCPRGRAGSSALEAAE